MGRRAHPKPDEQPDLSLEYIEAILNYLTFGRESLGVTIAGLREFPEFCEAIGRRRHKSDGDEISLARLQIDALIETVTLPYAQPFREILGLAPQTRVQSQNFRTKVARDTSAKSNFRAAVAPLLIADLAAELWSVARECVEDFQSNDPCHGPGEVAT